MATGTIAKIIDDKGFGFIAPEGGEKDLFFHARSVVGDVVFDDLREGDTVTFETEDGPKGPAAVNVEKADAAPAAEAAPAEMAEEAPAEAAPEATEEDAPAAEEETPAA
jgi:CspA family cold shock protein